MAKEDDAGFAQRIRRQAKRGETMRGKQDDQLRKTGVKVDHPQDFHALAAKQLAGMNEDDAADNETGESRGFDPADNWFGEVFKEKLDPKQYANFVRLMTQHDNLIESMDSILVDKWFESGGPLHTYADFIQSERDLQTIFNSWGEDWDEDSGEPEPPELTPKELRLQKIVDQVLEIIGPLGSEE